MKADPPKDKPASAMTDTGFKTFSPVSIPIPPLTVSLPHRAQASPRKEKVKRKKGEEESDLLQSILDHLDTSLPNSDITLRAKAVLARMKERVERATYEVEAHKVAHTKVVGECEKLRHELKQRKIQLRLEELKEMRRPRLVKGEPSQLLVQDRLWHALVNNKKGDEEDKSSLQSSLIGLTAKPFLDSLKDCNYDIQAQWQDSIHDTASQLEAIIVGMSRMIGQLGEMGKQLHEDDVISQVRKY